MSPAQPFWRHIPNKSMPIPLTAKQRETVRWRARQPVPMKLSSPRASTFFISSENRTYDQILGDILEGNRDTSLCLFGEKYIRPTTTNWPANFVLLDNFMWTEVSADGHNWANGRNANDYLRKTWPTDYGDRGGQYDTRSPGCGQSRSRILWDYCQRAG